MWKLEQSRTRMFFHEIQTSSCLLSTFKIEEMNHVNDQKLLSQVQKIFLIWNLWLHFSTKSYRISNIRVTNYMLVFAIFRYFRINCTNTVVWVQKSCIFASDKAMLPDMYYTLVMNFTFWPQQKLRDTYTLYYIDSELSVL